MPNNGDARTLGPSDLKTNSSGWEIEGEVHEDYYKWVNHFVAYHPEYGIVKGDYEDCIEAESKEAYEHFVKNHPPQIWDYGDI